MVEWIKFSDNPPPAGIDLLLCYASDDSIVMGRFVFDSSNQNKWRIDVEKSVVWWDLEDFTHWSIINRP